MILIILAAIGLAPPPQAPIQDSLDAIQHVAYLLSQYYPQTARDAFRSTRRSYGVSGSTYNERCDGDRGDVCFADDPDAGRCPNFVQCHRNPNHMIEVMVEAAGDYPSSGYLMGQAVYILTKQDRVPEATKLVELCSAAAWWCDALQGYVLHARARETESDAAFRRAMAAAPDSVACDWSDATWLLGQWTQRGSSITLVDAHEAAADWGCRRRMALSDSIWWLADPLYSVPGNDRWVEHLVRTMSARFYDEIRRTHTGSMGTEEFQKNLWAGRVRRGPVDSYSQDRGWTWTSRAAAHYHFVPDVAVDDLDAPTWRLEGHLDDEGYTPVYGPVVPIPQQTARFRAQGALAVAVATRIADTPVDGALDAAGSFVLSPGPGRTPVIFTSDPHQPTVRFTGTAPMDRYVASLEVATSKGVGWDRRVLKPLLATGSELSDLLLYRVGEDTEPSDLAGAAAAMRGSTEVSPGSELGVYWETYGAQPGDTLHFDLSVKRRSGGLIDRLSRLLPGGAQEGRGRIAWTEPATGATHASAVALNLGALDSGEYTLTLDVAWGDGLPMRRTRDITVQ